MAEPTAVSSGGPASYGADAVQVVRRFYSDWPTRPWHCGCGWVGRCEGPSTSEAPFPIVFRCPVCDAEVGWVDSPREGERSEADGVASVPLAMLDFWLQKLIDEPFPGRWRFPGGAEDEVLIRPDDWFFGVEQTCLLGRLRLDPAASPVDLEDGLGFQIYLADVPHFSMSVWPPTWGGAYEPLSTPEALTQLDVDSGASISPTSSESTSSPSVATAVPGAPTAVSAAPNASTAGAMTATWIAPRSVCPYCQRARFNRYISWSD